MNGFRSANAPDEQNLPTLEVVNDETTSGPFEPPARSAWFSLSSLMLPETFTVMFGWAFSNRSMFASTAFTSEGALQPCQKLIVVFAFGSSEAPASDWPVHAVASTDIAATATAVVVRRLVRMTELPGRGRDFRRQDRGGAGWNGGGRNGRGSARGVEHLVAGVGERPFQGAAQDGGAVDLADHQAGPGGGEFGQFGLDQRAQGLSARRDRPPPA